jgi:hypothetical protein
VSFCVRVGGEEGANVPLSPFSPSPSRGSLPPRSRSSPRRDPPLLRGTRGRPTRPRDPAGARRRRLGGWCRRGGRAQGEGGGASPRFVSLFLSGRTKTPVVNASRTRARREPCARAGSGRARSHLAGRTFFCFFEDSGVCVCVGAGERGREKGDRRERGQCLRRVPLCPSPSLSPACLLPVWACLGPRGPDLPPGTRMARECPRQEEHGGSEGRDTRPRR